MARDFSARLTAFCQFNVDTVSWQVPLRFRNQTGVLLVRLVQRVEAFAEVVEFFFESVVGSLEFCDFVAELLDVCGNGFLRAQVRNGGRGCLLE